MSHSRKTATNTSAQTAASTARGAAPSGEAASAPEATAAVVAVSATQVAQQGHIEPCASHPAVVGSDANQQAAPEEAQAQAPQGVADDTRPASGCAAADNMHASAVAPCTPHLPIVHGSLPAGSASRGLTQDHNIERHIHPHVGEAHVAITAPPPESSNETTPGAGGGTHIVTYDCGRGGCAPNEQAHTIVHTMHGTGGTRCDSSPPVPTPAVSSRRVDVAEGSAAAGSPARSRRARSPEPVDAEETRRRRARTLRFATPTATEIEDGAWVLDDNDESSSGEGDAPDEGPPAEAVSAESLVQRPPAAQTASSVAAAARIGLQTAGLAWLHQAAAANAPRSAADTAPPKRDREARGRAVHDVPLKGQAARFEREVPWPVPTDFVWPRFAFCAFYEHSGEEREAHAEVLGEATCSVADRRTILPPSRNAWHFICNVRDFLSVYPYPVRHQTNHVTCGRANWAAWRMWPTWILDGSLRATAEEFLWINCIGDRSEGEQPPTALQHLIGPPTYVVNGHQFGGPSKTYCKWARGLPAVPPTDVLPVGERWSELQVSGSTEEKMVKRSYSQRNLARASAHVQARVLGGDESEFGRPASQPCRQYPAFKKQLAHAFGLFAAHYAPTVAKAWLDASTRADAIILVPITHTGTEACALVSLHGSTSIFGAARDAKRAAVDQGEDIAKFVSGGMPTQYAAAWRRFGHKDCISSCCGSNISAS